MANDGTQFGIRLPVEGGSAVERAASALESVANKAEAAGKAVEAADAAVKSAEQSYKRAETAADKAAKAVEKVGAMAEEQKGKLARALEAGDASGAEKVRAKIAELASRQGELATKAMSAKSAVIAEAAALDKLKASAAAATGEQSKLEKQHEKAKETADKAKESAEKIAGSGKFNEAAEALGKLGGPLGVVGQKALGAVSGVSKLSSALGSAGPYVAIAVAIVAIVAGMAAMSAAAAIGTVKVGAWAVGMADAARTSQLLSAGVARSVAGGEKLDAQLDRLVTQVPLAREELLQMAGGLADAGFRGDALAKQLDIAAGKAAKLKFGPEFGKQLLSIGNQTTRLKTNIAGVFGGLKIEALLEAMAKLVALFDQTTSTGRAMKVLFESLFQPLIDGAAALVPKIIAAFIQVEIWVLKAAIAIKPFGSKILLLGEAFAIVAAVLVLLGGILVGLVLAPFILLGALLVAVTAGVLYFSDSIGAAIGWCAKFSEGLGGIVVMAATLPSRLIGIGVDMVRGIIQGVLAAGPELVKALGSVADTAIKGVKGKLDMHSPSKVMADEVGYGMGTGVAVGIDESAGDVRTALEGLTLPSDNAGHEVVATPAAAAASSSGMSIVVQGDLVFQGVKDAEDGADRFWERVMMKAGLAQPEPA